MSAAGIFVCVLCFYDACCRASLRRRHVTETIPKVILDHANCLHERVNDSWASERASCSKEMVKKTQKTHTRTQTTLHKVLAECNAFLIDSISIFKNSKIKSLCEPHSEQ